MAQQHSTTKHHYGHWVQSLRDLRCEACGYLIVTGERFLFFPWFPGRKHSVACVCCALGVDTVTPAFRLHSLPWEVAA